jgi:hypothetical protein
MYDDICQRSLPTKILSSRSLSKKCEQESRELLGIPASSRPFHQRRFRSRDCPLGKQSHANPTRPIQSFEVTNLSHRIAKDSPSKLLRKPHRLATTPRLPGSRREFLKLLIPCNLRKRRLLQVFRPVPRVRILSAPPRSLSCRESRLFYLRNTRKLPVFRDYSQTNRTAENGPLGSDAVTVRLFSEGHMRSPVSRRA